MNNDIDHLRHIFKFVLPVILKVIAYVKEANTSIHSGIGYICVFNLNIGIQVKHQPWFVLGDYEVYETAYSL